MDFTQGINKLFGEALKAHGFSKWAYQATQRIAGKPVIFGNYPKEWVDFYVQSDYSLIDPVVAHTQICKTPFLWSEAKRELSLTLPQKKLFRNASDFGLDEGIGFPIYKDGVKIGTISLVSKIEKTSLCKLFASEFSYINNLCLTYHEMVSKHVTRKALYHFTPTKREMQCLRYSALGMSYKETAQVLKISDLTVKKHLENVCLKTGFSNKGKVVMAALAAGLFSVEDLIEVEGVQAPLSYNGEV